METVCQPLLSHEADHRLHQVTATSHHDTSIFSLLQTACCCLHEIFATLLRRDTAEEGDHLLVCTALSGHIEDLLAHRLYGIVHSDTLRRVLMILLDHGATSEFRHTHDEVGMIHTIFFDDECGVARVAHTACTVILCRVYVYAQGLTAHLLGVDTSRIGEPVVGVDDVKLLFASDDTCHDRVVVDLFQQVFRILTRKLDTSQVVGMQM